jgi:hypothetical protein
MRAKRGAWYHGWRPEGAGESRAAPPVLSSPQFPQGLALQGPGVSCPLGCMKGVGCWMGGSQALARGGDLGGGGMADTGKWVFALVFFFFFFLL